MPTLILHTFGVLKYPDDHPASQEFWTAVPDVSSSIPNTSGMVKGSVNSFRAVGVSSKETTEFGVPISPHFYQAPQATSGLLSLSAWDESEAAAAFSFHGIHGAAMKHRDEWFKQDHDWPSSVFWWTDDLESVTWGTADDKLIYLHENGPSPVAFTFKSLYTSEGEPMRMDGNRVRELRSAD